MTVLRQHLALACLTCLMAACAAQQVGAARAHLAPATDLAEGVPAADPLLRLFAHVPNGADRCAAGRPSALTAEERRLMASVSGAPDLVWNGELGVDAFVVASRNRRGRISRVFVLQSTGTAEAFKRRLLAHSGLQLAFEPGPRACRPDACPTFVRFVAPHIVVLERGEWLSVPGAGGVEQRCAEWVRRHPGALEVMARRGDARADGQLVPLLRSAGAIEKRADGLSAVRTDVVASPEVAQAVAAARLTQPLVSWPSGPPPGVVGRLRRRAVGPRVLTTLRVRWDELAMLLEDRAREQAAIAYADTLAQMRPDGDVDVQQLEALLQQVHYRAEALSHGGSADHARMANSLRDLLARGLSAHPERRDLARLLSRVLLEELGAGKEAVALAQRMARLQGVDQAFWAQVERHGLALDKPAALAGRLRAHGMAEDRAEAAALSADVLSAFASGTPFDVAERAAVAARVLRRPTPMLPLEGLPAVPPADLVEALLILARLAGDAPYLWLLIEGPPLVLGAPPRPDRSQVVDAPLPAQAVRLQAPNQPARTVLQLARDGFADARRIGRALSAVGDAEGVTLRLSLGYGDGPGARVLVLSGAQRGGLLRLAQADEAAASAPFPSLVRSLVTPVGMLDLGQLLVPVPQGASSRRMRELAEGAFGLVCRESGGILSCAAAHHGREHVRATLAAMLAEPFGPAARTLFK